MFSTMTLIIMPPSIMILSITTFITMTLGRATLSITMKNASLAITFCSVP